MQTIDPQPGDPEQSQPILVVDDDPGVRDSVCWALEDEGFRVAAAENGLVALECAGEQRPALVVLDMAMPLLNGDGFAAALRRLYGAAVPILVLTADGRASQKAEQVSAFDYIQKPFEVDDLLDKVRRGLSPGV